MILTKAQAEAVYAAMVALNNVGADIGDINAKEFSVRVSGITGEIRVSGKKLTEREFYDSQAAFATAYGITLG